MQNIGIEVEKKVCNISDPFEFKVTFDCLSDIAEGTVEWKIVYVSCPDDRTFDQILLCKNYGAFPEGTHTITLKSEPLNMKLIPQEQLEGISFVLLTGIKQEESYYQTVFTVDNNYVNVSEKIDSPKIKLQRTILTRSQKVFFFVRDDTCNFDISKIENFFHFLGL